MAIGTVLDLACGRSPSYWRALGLDNNPRVWLVGVDREIAYHPCVVADLLQPLPFKDGVADLAIVSSYLYVPADPGQLLREVFRVLKPGRPLWLSVPLVFPYTPEPTDHWRFTPDSVKLLLRDAGFTDLVLVPLGGRCSAASYLLGPLLRPRWLLAPLAFWGALRVDSWLARRRNFTPCPLGYVVMARTSWNSH